LPEETASYRRRSEVAYTTTQIRKLSSAIERFVIDVERMKVKSKTGRPIWPPTIRRAKESTWIGSRDIMMRGPS
jgi:hypothetical protein